MKKEVVCILGNCSKLTRGRCTTKEAVETITTAADKMEDELLNATSAIKQLKRKNCSLAKENFNLQKEQKELRTTLTEKENELKEVQDELNASQRSLFDWGDTEEGEKDTPKD